MLNLQTLAGLLRDEELRQKLTHVTSAKIKADIKSLQANAELSRRLVESAVRPGARGDGAESEKVLKAIINEHLDYYGTLIDLSAAFSDRLLAMLAALKKEPSGAGATGPALAMNLKGPLGSTLRAPFEIENNRPEPITAVFRLTPYVSEDGSQLVAANHAFDPPRAVVPPRGKLRVLFVQPITEGFAAERDYLATISVEGLDAMQILVRLHVERPATTAAESPPQAAGAAEPPQAPADASQPPAEKPETAPAAKPARTGRTRKASAAARKPRARRPRS